MNPTSFLTPDIDSTGTFTNVVGANLTVDSPLTPFSTMNGSVWTSTGARDLANLGYTYPEIMDVSLLFVVFGPVRTSVRRRIRTRAGGW